ncbi:MAG TPA: hypothetical protein VFG04_11935 [Planctomycetaceae bacterium]|jgi:hypothetical protein|nr:hypothetical protein [Planctomycetaceae bacterium]
MFGRLFHKKREEVMRVLHGRVNRAHARSIACQNIRGATRQIFNEIVWALPCESIAKADFSQLFPAICRDLCTQGIGIFLNVPVHEPRMIIGLCDESEPRFLACTVKHCSPLGYGFYHAGLFPDEVMNLHREQIAAMGEALAKYAEHEAACETVTV